MEAKFPPMLVITGPQWLKIQVEIAQCVLKKYNPSQRHYGDERTHMVNKHLLLGKTQYEEKAVLYYIATNNSNDIHAKLETKAD
jgi:hypothetical protein